MWVRGCFFIFLNPRRAVNLTNRRNVICKVIHGAFKGWFMPSRDWLAKYYIVSTVKCPWLMIVFIEPVHFSKHLGFLHHLPKQWDLIHLRFCHFSKRKKHCTCIRCHTMQIYQEDFWKVLKEIWFEKSPLEDFNYLTISWYFVVGGVSHPLTL